MGTRYIVGVDVGGTNVVVGTVSEDGQVIAGIVREPTRVDEGADAVVDQVAAMVAQSITDAKAELGGDTLDVVGVGIGAPGPLDTDRGIVILTPNLGWKNFPLRDRVSDATGLPAVLDNDANCAVLGEWWQGAAQGASNVIGLTIGTGIGGGIVIGGMLYRGASDVAGEFGHMTIDSTGRRCNCGNYGCIEAYASGTAIAARAVEGIDAGADTNLPDLVDGDTSKITAGTVYHAASDGDEFAREVIRDTARFLGAAVANLVNIFNPDIVVICGGVTAAGDKLFTPLEAEVARRAFRPAVAACRIIPGTLHGTAGVFGAAAVFRRRAAGRFTNPE
jgi:glucokinase